MTVFCPNCGKPNVDGRTACVACHVSLRYAGGPFREPAADAAPVPPSIAEALCERVRALCEVVRDPHFWPDGDTGHASAAVIGWLSDAVRGANLDLKDQAVLGRLDDKILDLRTQVLKAQVDQIIKQEGYEIALQRLRGGTPT